MAPKRRLDERRKLQNREAQRRFRERAKQKVVGMKKEEKVGKMDGIGGGGNGKSKSNEKREDGSSFSSSSSSSITTTNIHSDEYISQQNLSNDGLLQSALMASFYDFNPTGNPVTTDSTCGLLIHDSKSPSASSSSACSSQRSNSATTTTTNWIGLPIETNEDQQLISTAQITSTNFIQIPSSQMENSWSHLIEQQQQAVDFSPYLLDQQQTQQQPQQQSNLFNFTFPDQTISKLGSCNEQIERWNKNTTNETVGMNK